MEDLKSQYSKEDSYYQDYLSWRDNQTPDSNAFILKKLDPVIRRGIQIYAPSANEVDYSKAKIHVLNALKTYDPKKSTVATHITNHLRSLNREVRQRRSPVRIPDRWPLMQSQLVRYEEELQDSLGRVPTTQELADKSGISVSQIERIRRWNPRSEMSFQNEEGQSSRESTIRTTGDPQTKAYLELLYDSLSPVDQKIVEWTTGLYGNKSLSNAQIAKKLNITPGAVSQRKKKIHDLHMQLMVSNVL